MMQSIVQNTSVAASGKRLANHSARKTVVKKLRAANVEKQSIIQVTGHATEQSHQNYNEGNEEEQRVLSTIISNQQQFPKEVNSSQVVQRRCQDANLLPVQSTSSAAWQ